MRKTVLSLSLFLTPKLWAQPTAAPPPVSAPPTVLEGRFEAGSRLLLPGDQLQINIYSLPETEKNYQIRADGTFYHPLAGEIPAAGKTMKQLETLLTQRLKKELRNPSFRLGLISMAEAEASVLGEVRSQGKFKFPAGTSVMDLVAQAGGLSEKADPDSAVLWRAGKAIPLNLNPSGQAELSKFLLRSGDILVINRGRRIGVAGEVQTKGVYAISGQSPNPVEEAIKAAGGANDTAALSHIKIIRPTLADPIFVNLLDPVQSRNVKLEDGDTVMVQPRQAVVLGAVNKPGALSLTGKENLLGVVSQVGVVTGARLDSVVVIRAADVQAGNDKKEIYNLSEAFGEGKQTINVPVTDGDVVYVPPEEKGGLTNGMNLVSLLLVARSLFSI